MSDLKGDYMEKYFYCYSARLKNALTNNGFKPICSALNKNSKAEFWLFLGTEELNKYKNETYPTTRGKE